MEPNNAKSPPQTIKVTISSDGMSASVFIEQPAPGEAPVTAQMIEEALKKEGVCFGIDNDILAAIECTPRYGTEIPAAHGAPPQNGTDGKAIFTFRPKTDGHPKLRENGTVDFRNLDLISNVKKGQLLCTVTPPTDGIPGTTVTGQKTAPLSGKPAEVFSGRNTQFSPDGTKLVATADGQVVLEDTHVVVNESLVLSKNVDNATGNIHFVGNVNIYGNILEGFSVEAAGNVEVGGSVYGGSITTGGDLTIRGGIIGKNSSKIKCKGNLSAGFMENCSAETGGSIKSQSIMNCTIRCKEMLVLDGPHAKLMGGNCVVGQDITAKSIGSPANLPTILTVGVDPDIILKRNAKESELKELHDRLDKISQIISLLGQYKAAGKLTPDREILLDKSRKSFAGILQSLAKSTKERDSLTEYIEKMSNSKIICREVMYSKVRLTIGTAKLEVKLPVTASVFTNEKGLIKANPIA